MIDVNNLPPNLSDETRKLIESISNSLNPPKQKLSSTEKNDLNLKERNNVTFKIVV